MADLFKQIPLIILLCLSNLCMSSISNSNTEIETVIHQMIKDITDITKHYNGINQNLIQQLYSVNIQLKNASTVEDKVTLLIKKDELKATIEKNKLSEATDISKIRYLKGLQIIKILYEKTLALDHHYASVATFNEINNLSNPNHYPEFLELKDVLYTKKEKKIGFDLSTILGNNVYTSVLHSFVSLFTNTNASKQEKESSLKEVECILDFSLRMHNDLNTIYFETAFLQKSNDNIIKELEQLFIDFTKPIHYKVALKACRNSDDWDTIRELLNDYLNVLTKISKDESQQYKAHKMQINLEFPTDRLLQFITQYNSHINQGAKFYEKFGIMLNSYENEQQCSEKIPTEYKKLKENISIAIEKFNTAYKPVEINGSKMKEVLYGINEYD